jgi:hypothetical protein
LFKRVHTKFTLQFLDIPSSFYKFWKFELFLGILLNRKEKENETRRLAVIPAQGHSARRGGGGWTMRWPARRTVSAVGVRAMARLPAALRRSGVD